MGTSKGYSAPTTPEWAKQKAEITRLSNNGAVSIEIARDVFNKFISIAGGNTSDSGTRRAVENNSVAHQTIQRIASFISSVANNGLDQTLIRENLSSLIGRSAQEFALTIVDRLSGDGSTLDEADARNALSDLINFILKDTETYEDVTKTFDEIVTEANLGILLAQYFGYYLFRQFCRVYYERLVTRHGRDKAESFINSIKEMISSLVSHQIYEKNIFRVDWSGVEGRDIINNILERTYSVFEEG